MEPLGEMAVFAAVVQGGGFSAAARRLGISKSSVSKSVARIEDRLGARLLNRTTRRLSLTAAGEAYLEGCVAALEAARQAEEAVARLQGEPRGALKVSAPMSFGIRHLAPLLPDFLARYPDLTVDLCLDDEITDLVAEGFDLAIRISRLADSSLVARRLCASPRVVCGSPDYFARHGTPRHPRELAEHNCLVYTLLLGGDDWRYSGPDGEGSVRLAGTLRCNNGDALRQAMLAGVGISPLPTFLVGEDIQAGRLVPVLTDWVDRSGTIFAVYPHSRHLSAKVRLFVDYLSARFGPRPPWEPDLVV